MKFFFFILFFHSSLCLAAVSECGQYNANGVIRQKGEEIVLIVNEGTQSAYSIVFNDQELIKLTPYLDEPVRISFDINKSPTSFILKADKILKIDERIPNPLMAQDTFLKIKTKRKCLNSK